MFPRKLAITKASGDQVALFSVDLVDGRLQRTALPNQPWRLAVVTPSALKDALRMLPFNTNQNAAASARVRRPLVVRLIEPYGTGVFGATGHVHDERPGRGRRLERGRHGGRRVRPNLRVRWGRPGALPGNCVLARSA